MSSVQELALDNVVKVSSKKDLTFYVRSCIRLHKDGVKTMIFKGIGSAISKTLHLAEIMKRRIGGLYQMNEIYSIEVDDKRQDSKPGNKKNLTALQITLSVDQLDEKMVGYQSPVQRELSDYNPKFSKFATFH